MGGRTGTNAPGEHDHRVVRLRGEVYDLLAPIGRSGRRDEDRDLVDRDETLQEADRDCDLDADGQVTTADRVMAARLSSGLPVP